MAKRTFNGQATVQQQIHQVTVGSNTAGQTIIFTFLDKNTGETDVETYTITAADTSPAAAAASAVAQFNKSVKRLTALQTYSVPASTAIIQTAADDHGRPFSLTVSGTATLTSAGNTQENSGPNDWDTPGNWLEGDVPVAADDVNITGSVHVLYSLNKSAVTYGKVTRVKGCTAELGTGPSDRLSFACTGFEDYGSGRAWVNLNASAVAPIVENGRLSIDGGYEVDVIGSAMTILHARKGRVGVAVNAGETSTLPVVNCHGGASVVLGLGVAGHTTFRNTSVAASEIHCDGDVVEVDAGQVTTWGSGAYTTYTVNGGTLVSNTTGVVTNSNVSGSGVVDTLQSRTPRNFTNVSVSGSGRFKRDSAVANIPGTISITGRGDISGPEAPE